jgi:S1-C subfamily serine protease
MEDGRMQQVSREQLRLREWGAKGWAWAMCAGVFGLMFSLALGLGLGLGGCVGTGETDDLGIEFERAAVVMLEGTERGYGSGFLMAPGYVVTVAHAAEHNPSFKVRTWAGWEGIGEVVQIGDTETLDYAVLQLESEGAVAKGQTLPVVSCRKLKVGEKLRSWGQSEFADWLTAELTVASAMEGPAGTVIVNGPIIQGMSGGPVFDREHNVVGINVGIFSTEPFGFPQMTAYGMILPMERLCDKLNWNVPNAGEADRK